MHGTLRDLRIIVPALCGAVLLAGCASAGGPSAARTDRCKGQTLDAMFAGGPTVFRACEVDRAARPVASSIRSAMGPSGGMTPPAGCARAVLEFIVDERGVPQADRIRPVRSTSADLLDQMKRAVPLLRYTPALKDGQPVAQVVSFELIRSATVVVSRGGGPPPAPPRRPNC